MLLNSAKTQTMKINLKKDSCHCNIAGNSPSEHAKLLGIIIDATLTFKMQVNEIRKKCNSRLYAMRKFKQSGTDTGSLLRFYSARIMPIINMPHQHGLAS